MQQRHYWCTRKMTGQETCQWEQIYIPWLIRQHTPNVQHDKSEVLTVKDNYSQMLMDTPNHEHTIQRLTVVRLENYTELAIAHTETEKRLNLHTRIAWSKNWREKWIYNEKEKKNWKGVMTLRPDNFLPRYKLSMSLFSLETNWKMNI